MPSRHAKAAFPKALFSRSIWRFTSAITKIWSIKTAKFWVAKWGFDAKRLVAAQQVHGSHVQTVYDYDAGDGACNYEWAHPKTDALVACEKNLPVLILVADCAPILLAKPESEILAVVHAGWRGALAGIAGNAAREMAKLGANLSKIQAGIGPCLCPKCLEIGAEVAAQVEPIDAEAIWSGWEKPHLDLRGLIKRDLSKSGVLESNIETMNHCPKCENQLFFSHRGQNGVAGRFGLVVFWQ